MSWLGDLEAFGDYHVKQIPFTVSLPVWVSCLKKCKESDFFCKHPALDSSISILIVFAAPFLALEVLCSGCIRNDLVRIFSLEFKHTELCLHDLFYCCFLEYPYFSLVGFSKATMGVDYGPPSIWLVGTPLALCSQVVMSRGFCSLGNECISVCDSSVLHRCGEP